LSSTVWKIEKKAKATGLCRSVLRARSTYTARMDDDEEEHWSRGNQTHKQEREQHSGRKKALQERTVRCALHSALNKRMTPGLFPCVVRSSIDSVGFAFKSLVIVMVVILFVGVLLYAAQSNVLHVFHARSPLYPTAAAARRWSVHRMKQVNSILRGKRDRDKKCEVGRSTIVRMMMMMMMIYDDMAGRSEPPLDESYGSHTHVGGRSSRGRGIRWRRRQSLHCHLPKNKINAAPTKKTHRSWME
jgi:hypothetical protein